jgi:hypothetical protein
MSRVVCGCSVLILRVDDGQDKILAGECELCDSNGGRYDRSPHYHELKPRPVEKTPEDVKEHFEKRKEKRGGRK